MVSDVPVQTVTVFIGGTEARAHTFDSWLTIDEDALVAAAIADFRAAHFPGF